TDGILQSAAEVQASAQPDAKPCDVRYVDLNGDGRITDADRYDAGSAVPDVTGGLFLDGHYHRFDFTLNLRGSAGGKIFNVARYWTDRMDDISNLRAVLAPWSPPNPSTNQPRPVTGPEGSTNLDLHDPNVPRTGSFWQTAGDALAGVNAAYNALQNNGTYGRWLVFATDLRSDIGMILSPWTDLSNFTKFTFTSYDFEVNREIWQHHYQAIFRANQVI